MNRIAALFLGFFVLSASIAGCSSSSSGGEKGGVDPALSVSDQDLALEEQRWRDGGAIPEAMEGGLFRDIHFDYDSSIVRAEDRETVRKNAQALAADETLHAEVEGHCDKRGTNEYNLALGEARAKAVASLMLSFGARSSQISIISYGEEIPLDPAEDEEAYSKNRRVHFALYRAKTGKTK